MLKKHSKQQSSVTDTEIKSSIQWALNNFKNRRFATESQLAEAAGVSAGTISNWMDFDKDLLPEAVTTLIRMLCNYDEKFFSDIAAIAGFAGGRKMRNDDVNIFELHKVNARLNADLSAIICDNNGRIPNTQLKEITDRALEVNVASGAFVQSARRSMV